MLSYTKATLKDHLSAWVEGNGAQADEDFVNALDEIIQSGEVKLSRDLDLDSLDSVSTVSTVASAAEVFKPDNLIAERLLVVVDGDGKKKSLVKRGRAYIEELNSEDEEGVPQFYSEFDEDRWFFAHVPDDIYLVFVHGDFTPASIVDGDDDTTTWFSTRVPDLLALACESEAARYLKFWAKKAEADASYTAKLDNARAITANLQRSDIEDIVGSGQRENRPSMPPAPEATN